MTEEPIQILVVDDETDFEVLVRQKFRKEIRSGALNFEFAFNGIQALEAINNNPKIQIVFTDINMPEMDGLTLLENIQNLSERRNIRTIIVSAYGDMENIRTAMNRGAYDFLTKPVNFDDFISVIEKTKKEGALLTEAYSALEKAEKGQELALKLKDEAQASQKFKEQFLANMSHEIRTPMNSILGFAKLLNKSELDESQKKQLNAILQSGEYLLAIINDILDLSKIEAGKMVLEIIPMDLDKLLQTVYQTLMIPAEAKGLKLILDVSDDVPNWVYGDRIRMSQILINLAGNAIKFTLSGSVTIKVSVVNKDSENAELLFEVKDTGIGIVEHKQAHIFESFSQETSATTRRFGGTGLGLTISKELVTAMGGTIGVKSKPGEGSNFYFSISFKISESIIHEDELDSTPMELKDVRILLVEDNMFNQMVATDTLKDVIEGVNIDIAENGLEAVDKIKNNDYDVVLMDVQMPEMDGHQATRAVRQLDIPNSKIPIMAMTAGASQQEIQNCFDAGMDEYISKPFDTDDLINKIGKLINQSK